MKPLRKLVQPGIPLYIQIAQDLEKAVRRGTYGVGNRLPQEAQLQKNYGVSKFTVREALKRLEMKGMVEKRHGVGTIVLGSTPQRPINYVVSDLGDFIRTAQQARLKKLSVERRGLERSEAEPFGLNIGEPFAIVKGVRVVSDEKIIAYVKVYLPKQYAAVADRIGDTPGLVASLVEEQFGVPVHVLRQEISAPVIGPRLRGELRKARLGLPSDRPLVSRRWYIDESGEVILCSENVFLEPDFSFHTVFSRT